MTTPADEARLRAEAERLREERKALAAREMSDRLEAVTRAAADLIGLGPDVPSAASQPPSQETALLNTAEMQARLEADLLALEHELGRQLEEERQALRGTAPVSAQTSQPVGPPAAASVQKADPTWTAKLAGWFSVTASPRASSPAKRAPAKESARAAPSVARARPEAKPRVLFIERRRATADIMVPRLASHGVECKVVERWVDAVDELFRLKPHAIFLDVEHPEFLRMHRTVTQKASGLPIILTGREDAAVPDVPRVAFVARPYDVEQLLRLALHAASDPDVLLAPQFAQAESELPESPSLRAARAGEPDPGQANDAYEVACFHCGFGFDAGRVAWCRCERGYGTPSCPQCSACFCTAPVAVRERFWHDAPPSLFARSMSLRPNAGVRANPTPDQAARPLILLVDPDRPTQLLLHSVTANLGWGLVIARTGMEGMALARTYQPDLVLVELFMPRPDGRELCRMLKNDPATAIARSVIMTGPFRGKAGADEAGAPFADDTITKPLAIPELLRTLRNHRDRRSDAG